MHNYTYIKIRIRMRTGVKMRFECTAERPWGVHPALLNDAICTRCGWTAPGPIGDARQDAEEILGRARELGWVVFDFGTDETNQDRGAALAA
jgi:hypothetical protein